MVDMFTCYSLTQHSPGLSYLSNRKQFITPKGFNSITAAVNHGVPQGSALSPLLFTPIYMLLLGQIICNHGPAFTATLMTVKFTSAPTPLLSSQPFNSTTASRKL